MRHVITVIGGQKMLLQGIPELRLLILVRGCSLSSRLMAYAGRWGGGDVVMTSEFGELVLGPTRYLLLRDGRLELREY